MTAVSRPLEGAVDGRYAIERELGRGGMATVYLARDTRQDRPVALKVLHRDLAALAGPERFRREIQVGTQLSHPHVLPLYDSGEVDGQLYYVMPFVDGESLRQRLDRERQLSIEESLRIACEVASALDYAHRHGVVHRDLKPENILLADGHAVVADFGIARALGESSADAITKTGVALGTPLYMSPEQAVGERELDGRSDEYALACVLFEMIAGHPPFSGANSQAIMARHTLEPPPSLQIVRASVPDGVEQAIQRALAKSPDERFPTVARFADALRNSDTAATAARRVERRLVPRGASGRRRLQLSALLLPLPLFAGAWAAWRFWLHPAPAAFSATVGALDPRRVAVMYFDDLSPDHSLAYAADGLTDALIEQLGQVRVLDVVSRNGVASFRDGGASPDSVARALAAGTVVTGTVEESGPKLRVAVRMVDGNSGVEIKRKSFEQPAASILAMRDSIAASAAEFLRERLGDEVRLREQQGGTHSVSAWTLVQRAAKLKRDAEGSAARSDSAASARDFALADTLLARAEALDPAWSDPAALRAELAYSRSRIARTAQPASPFIEQGLAHAERALALQPKSAGALAVRGLLRYWKFLLDLEPDRRKGDALLAAANSDLKAAVALDASRAAAWSALAHLRARTNDLVGAKLAARRAYEEDAYLSAADQILWRLYTASYDLEQFTDATHWCDEGKRRFPENPRFVECKLWLLTTPAVPPDANEGWRLLGELKKWTPASQWPYEERLGQILVAAALARSGEADSARRVLLRARAGPDVDPNGLLVDYEAFVRTLFNTPADRDEALRLLKLSASAHPSSGASLEGNQSWWWKSLRDDPRFQEIYQSSSGR